MPASDVSPAASNALVVDVAPRPRRLSLVKTTLKFAAAIALGIGVASGLQAVLHPAAIVAEHPVAAFSATLPASLVNPPVLAPHLNASVVVGGQRFDNPEQLALPTDSVFELNLGSDHSGQLAVYAINPEGQASHLWGTHLQAGQDQRSPKLRLQGLRGLETLRIVFAADDTPTGQRAATLVKQIMVLHV